MSLRTTICLARDLKEDQEEVSCSFKHQSADFPLTSVAMGEAHFHVVPLYLIITPSLVTHPVERTSTFSANHTDITWTSTQPAAC